MIDVRIQQIFMGFSQVFVSKSVKMSEKSAESVPCIPKSLYTKYMILQLRFLPQNQIMVSKSNIDTALKLIVYSN